MPFYKYISSSFFFFILVFYFYFVFSSPLVVLQHLGCVGYRAFEGDMEKEGGHPARKQLEQCCGVLKSRFSFLPTILCPGSVRGSYSARHDTNSGQKKKKGKKKKVKKTLIYIYINIYRVLAECAARCVVLYRAQVVRVQPRSSVFCSTQLLKSMVCANAPSLVVPETLAKCQCGGTSLVRLVSSHFRPFQH